MPWFLLSWVKDAVFALALLLAVCVAAREGLAGLARRSLTMLRLVPGVESLIRGVVRREVRRFLRQLEKEKCIGGEREGGREKKTMQLPEKGLSNEELIQELKKRKGVETDPHAGKIFAYVYTREGAKFDAVETAFDMFEFGDNSGADGEEGEEEGAREEERDGEEGRGEEGEEGVTGEGQGDKEGETKESADKKEINNKSKAALVGMFYHAFLHENALNPMVFPSLARFETETVAMTAGMLHGDERVVGSVTSGGTESILMAVKTYRDRARDLWPHITQPEMVAPQTIHPAFEKAASYFNVTVVHVPLNPDLTPNMAAYEKAITTNTILLLCSAPEYCYGMVDPVPTISRLAVRHNLPLHVDACFGGFMLPWVEKLGYSLPEFDFRLPGVTSMSADIHKYGLGIKGASVVLYRDEALRRYQIFAYAEWPGGLFGSPSMAGSRPGGIIAASWAILQAMGVDGYTEMARKLMDVTVSLKQGISDIPGLEVCGSPVMTAFSVRSCDSQVSIFAVADVMEKNGWTMERQMDSLHFSILPSHTPGRAQQLLSALRQAVITVKANPALSRTGSAGLYGMVAKIPDKAVVNDFILEFFNELYTL